MKVKLDKFNFITPKTARIGNSWLQLSNVAGLSLQWPFDNYTSLGECIVMKETDKLIFTV